MKASLNLNGFFCRELKLEIAALHSTAANSEEVDGFKSVFVRLLESLLTWQNAAESALQSAGIDVQTSTDCQYISCLLYTSPSPRD